MSKMKVLRKVTPVLSVVFIFIGLILAVISILDFNMMTLASSIMLILQAVLLLIYFRSFEKMWKK